LATTHSLAFKNYIRASEESLKGQSRGFSSNYNLLSLSSPQRILAIKEWRLSSLLSGLLLLGLGGSFLLGGLLLDGGSLDGGGLHRGGGSDGVLLLVGGLLLLEVLGEELLVLLVGLLGVLPALDLSLLHVGLSADSLLSDESLNLRGLVVGLIANLELSLDDVLGHIVLLLEGEGLSDVAGSLGAESSGSLLVGESGDFTLSLNEDLEGDDSEIGSADASSDRLSLSLSVSAGSVEGGS